MIYTVNRLVIETLPCLTVRAGRLRLSEKITPIQYILNAILNLNMDFKLYSYVNLAGGKEVDFREVELAQIGSVCVSLIVSQCPSHKTFNDRVPSPSQGHMQGLGLLSICTHADWGEDMSPQSWWW